MSTHHSVNRAYLEDYSKLRYQFGSRLKSLASSLNADKQEDFAKILGVKQQMVSRWFRGDSLPSLKNLCLIARATNTSIQWLLFGSDSDEFTSDTHAFIPLYAVEAAAGLDGIANGDYPEVLDKFPFKRSWLQSKHCGTEEKIKKLALIKVRGDSMEPTIYDGELVLVDTDERVRVPESIKNSGVYILRWGRDEEGISVKRVHLDWADGLIIAKSDNELYRPKEIRVGDKPLPWYVLGKVIWVGKENI
jgi:phage repressor protein C with HTH and peptisase S24 domain